MATNCVCATSRTEAGGLHRQTCGMSPSSHADNLSNLTPTSVRPPNRHPPHSTTTPTVKPFHPRNFMYEITAHVRGHPPSAPGRIPPTPLFRGAPARRGWPARFSTKPRLLLHKAAVSTLLPLGKTVLRYDDRDKSRACGS